MDEFKYAAINEARIYDSNTNVKKKIINRILRGTYVKILEEQGDWYKVETAGPDGWMRKDDLTDDMGLKVFFLDVGQGDGVLVEVGKYKILIDAGPNKSMHSYLTKWQYTYLLKEDKKVHIDYLIVSHFDIDHYRGFVEILKNQGFTFGTIAHPGILKYVSEGNPYKTGLGDTVKKGKVTYLTHIFDDLLSLNSPVPFNRDVTAFLTALQGANAEGRVGNARRYEKGDVIVSDMVEGKLFKLEALAPFTEQVNNQKAFVYWKDEGVTINGHSLVLKLTFGNKTVLLGGDLNTNSQEYLMAKYGANHPFEVDVAKSCHHGSSEFSEVFMGLVNPYATVISSGDNEGHAHPRADAIGCAGKYSKSIRPLVYSTELARSTDLRTNSILYGMINLRCNGTDIYMSQMKEVKKDDDRWDSYEVK
jgi:beta-lactamase superfamily II metal-dependent hydrolase